MRGIPPRTMKDVSRRRARLARPAVGAVARPSATRATQDSGVPIVRPFVKPRQWRYQTRPSFKRVRGPLVDTFNEAQEVLIVVDLGGFTLGEISLSRSPQQYVLRANRGDQHFSEVIELPANVDIRRAREHLANGVLEIVLPRTGAGVEPADLGNGRRKE